MLDPSSEGSNPSTPTNDTKIKGRGAQVYVPRHRREADSKSQADDKEKEERRDKTPNKNGPLRKSSESKITPTKDSVSSLSDSSIPSSPLTSTPPKQTQPATPKSTTPKSNSKETKNTPTDGSKKTIKPKTKTVVVPLSLLDISDDTPQQKGEDIKSKNGPQKVTLSLNDMETENIQTVLSTSTTTTTPSKSNSSSSAPSTPSISSSSPSSTPLSKKIPPTHAISLVTLDDEPSTPHSEPYKKQTLKEEKESNTNNNNGKGGDTSGSEEEWETSWEATLETLKVENSNSKSKSKTDSSSKTETPNIVRGRGRKKFDDDGAEIGTSHPDVEGDDGGNLQTPTKQATTTTNKESSNSGESALSSVDRADAQKQFSHILEIHSFPLTTTTDHLNDYLKDYSSLYRLKWVNDTAALAIFKSPKIATDALSKLGNGKYKLRAISEASEESIATASRSLGRKVEEKVIPYQTTTTVARRLIANALNMSFKPAPGSNNNTDDIEQMRETKRKMWEDDDV